MDNAFDRQNERISLAKKRVADAKKLYPWNHPVVQRLAEKRDQLIQDLRQMERDWQARQPRPATPSQPRGPLKSAAPGSSFLPKNYDSGQSGGNLLPSDWVKAPDPIADLEIRLKNPERFGVTPANPVPARPKQVMRNGRYFQTPEGKYINESWVAGKKRVIGFDHAPTADEVKTARIKLLKQDHPELFEEYIGLRKSFDFARKQAAMIGSLIDDKALNSQDYETRQLSNQAFIPGNVAQMIRAGEKGKWRAFMQMQEQAKGIKQQLDSLLKTGKPVQAEPEKNLWDKAIGTLGQYTDEALQFLEENATESAKMWSGKFRPLKKQVDKMNAVVNPAIDGAYNIATHNYAGLAKTLENKAKGNVEPGFIASAINPTNWAVSKLALDPEAYKNQVDKHLETGDVLGFTSDVVSPVADVLGFLGPHVPASPIISRIGGAAEEGLFKFGRNAVENFTKKAITHAPKGSDGFILGWRETQKSFAKELESIIANPKTSSNLRSEAIKRLDEVKASSRANQPHPDTLQIMSGFQPVRPTSAVPPVRPVRPVQPKPKHLEFAEKIVNDPRPISSNGKNLLLQGKEDLRLAAEQAGEKLNRAIRRGPRYDGEIEQLHKNYFDLKDAAKTNQKAIESTKWQGIMSPDDLNFSHLKVNKSSFQSILKEAERVHGRRLKPEEVEHLRGVLVERNRAVERIKKLENLDNQRGVLTDQQGLPQGNYKQSLAQAKARANQASRILDDVTTIGKSRGPLEKFNQFQQGNLNFGSAKMAKALATSISSEGISAIEDLLGPAIGKLPGMGKAGTETMNSSRAWMEGMKEFFKGETYADALKKAKTGFNSLDQEALANGIKTDATNDVSWFLQMSQNIQGAIRTPVQRAAYQRELTKQLLLGKRLGKDLTSKDFLVNAQREAFEASQRAILRNDNKLNSALKSMSEKRPFLETGYPLARTSTNYVGRMGEYVGGIPYGAIKHVRGIINGGMTAKDAAAVARAYKRGGVGAGLFAAGYYGADLGIAVDKKGNVKIGNYIVPEKLTHAPWFEIVKLGAKYQQNKGSFIGSGKDLFKSIATNAPGNEVVKGIFSLVDGEDPWATKYLSSNVVPQAGVEILFDRKKLQQKGP